MHRIPAGLYEIVPYLYLLVGVFASLGLDSLFGRVCGLLLISAAVLILILRRDNRTCLSCNSKLFAEEHGVKKGTR